MPRVDQSRSGDEPRAESGRNAADRLRDARSPEVHHRLDTLPREDPRRYLADVPAKLPGRNENLARNISEARAPGARQADAGRERRADRPPDREWKTVAEETGLNENWSDFEEAKKALPRLPTGHVYHHIVEQCQAKNDRSRFDTRKINSTDNLVAVPDEVNNQLNYYFGSKDKVTGMLVRDMLNGTSWDFQYREGCRELGRVMKEMGR